jgi:hypothetical protein
MMTRKHREDSNCRGDRRIRCCATDCVVGDEMTCCCSAVCFQIGMKDNLRDEYVIVLVVETCIVIVVSTLHIE